MVQAQLMASGGLEPKDICVLSYYGKQVQKIRYLLREKKLGQVRRCYHLKNSLSKDQFAGQSSQG